MYTVVKNRSSNHSEHVKLSEDALNVYNVQESEIQLEPVYTCWQQKSPEPTLDPLSSYHSPLPQSPLFSLVSFDYHCVRASLKQNCVPELRYDLNGYM